MLQARLRQLAPPSSRQDLMALAQGAAVPVTVLPAQKPRAASQGAPKPRPPACIDTCVSVLLELEAYTETRPRRHKEIGLFWGHLTGQKRALIRQAMRLGEALTLEVLRDVCAVVLAEVETIPTRRMGDLGRRLAASAGL